MSFLAGSPDRTWKPVMTAETNTLSYWLNWRFLLCALFVAASMVLSTLLIWKYEGFRRPKSQSRENSHDSVGSLYEDESWRTCLKGIHPAWLLAYRIVAFSVLLALILSNFVVDGAGIFFFYTQWTFILVTLYFGLASSFSIYGCFRKGNIDVNTMDRTSLDAERGTYIPPILGEGSTDMSYTLKGLDSHEDFHICEAAGVWGYAFQIIFQTSAGAVVLTDAVFWFILYPFLMSGKYELSFFVVTMHSVNAVCLLGETILNGLRFPMFRVGYFILWTATFVLFQWIVHACVSMWWPYPFLDLSTPYAPLWYAGIGIMNIPCYAAFALVVRIKRSILSRSFPESYQGWS